MTSSQPRAPLAVTAFASLSERGLLRAQGALSAMLAPDVRVTTSRLEVVPLDALVRLAVAAEAPVGLHVVVGGEAAGSLLVVFPLASARALLAILGVPRDGAEAPSALERSALAEMGNLLASSFLTELGDATRLRLLPSPPTVLVEDLPRALAEVQESLRPLGPVNVIHGMFEDPKRGIQGDVFVLPGAHEVTTKCTE